MLSRASNLIGRIFRTSYCHVRSKVHSPIIVYQMGKVGSSSVTQSLNNSGCRRAYNVHRMDPDNMARVRQYCLENNRRPPNDIVGKRLYTRIVKEGKRAKFITLVREPIRRNVSAFFQNLNRFIGNDREQLSRDIGELAKIFIQEYNHFVPLTWFDVEMKQTLGIDVYEHPFPKKAGYLSVGRGRFQVLILKAEIEDRIKEKAIREFLGSTKFNLVRTNIGKDKDSSFAPMNRRRCS